MRSMVTTLQRHLYLICGPYSRFLCRHQGQNGLPIFSHTRMVHHHCWFQIHENSDVHIFQVLFLFLDY